MKKKIEIEILKDDPVGLTKGEKKTMSPMDAKIMIDAGQAKKIREVVVPSRKNTPSIIADLSDKVIELEIRIEKIEKKKQ